MHTHHLSNRSYKCVRGRRLPPNSRFTGLTVPSLHRDHQRHLLRSSCALARPADEVIATRSYSASDDSEPDTPQPGGWWNKNTAPNMKDIHSIQQLVDELADAGDKLVIVEFFAPWCNACKALFPKLCRIMSEHQDDILFLKVNFELNKDMCKTMGIKVLPMFHFYRGAEGKVDSFTCTISKLEKFKEALEKYTAAFCSLSDPPGVEEYPDVRAHPEVPHGVVTVPDKPTQLHPDLWQ